MMASSVSVQLFGALIVFLFPGERDVPLVIEAQSVSAIPDVYVKLNHDAEFRWEASVGSSGLGIQIIAWRKDSVLVAQMVGSTFVPNGAYVGRVTQSGSAGIILSNATKADEGTYECTVTFTDGTPYTHSAKLEIAELASAVWMTVFWTVILNDTRQLKVEIGEVVNLTCYSKGGKPPPTYTFQTPDGTVNATTSNSLVINSFQATHAGEYSCIASNMAGDVTSDFTLLSIIVVGFSLPPWAWGVIGGLLALLLFVIIVCWLVQRGRLKPKLWIAFSHSSGREVEFQWTAKCKGSYKVGYRCKGSEVKKWTSGPEVSTNNYPNYNYTVIFPKDGEYEVCVQGNITRLCCLCWPRPFCLCCLCCQCKVTSDCKDVTVPIEGTAPYGGPGNGSSGERSMPV